MISLDQVTFIVKTIHRPWACRRLIESIREYAPRALIHVLDDGRPDQQFRQLYPETSVDHYIETEFDIGISQGRNRLIDSVTTPYAVLLDDDHVLTDKTHLQEMLDRFVSLGDRVDLLAFGKGCQPRSLFVDKRRRVMYGLVHAHQVEGSVQWCDLTWNAFLAKTEMLQTVRWDGRLKIYEHWDFFLRTRRQGFTVAIDQDHSVKHDHVNNAIYRPLRFRGRFKKIVLRKHRLRHFSWGGDPDISRLQPVIG